MIQAAPKRKLGRHQLMSFEVSQHPRRSDFYSTSAAGLIYSSPESGERASELDKKRVQKQSSIAPSYTSSVATIRENKNLNNFNDLSARLRYLRANKLTRLIMVKRKTSTGSNSSQHSSGPESGRNTPVAVAQAKRLVKRRTSDSLTQSRMAASEVGAEGASRKLYARSRLMEESAQRLSQIGHDRRHRINMSLDEDDSYEDVCGHLGDEEYEEEEEGSDEMIDRQASLCTDDDDDDDEPDESDFELEDEMSSELDQPDAGQQEGGERGSPALRLLHKLASSARARLSLLSSHNNGAANNSR